MRSSSTAVLAVVHCDSFERTTSSGQDRLVGNTWNFCRAKMVGAITRALFLRTGRGLQHATRPRQFAYHVASRRSFSMLQIPKWEYALQSSAFWPSNIVERVMELVHLGSGFSWAPSIMLYTVLMRLALFPVNVIQVRASIKSLQLRPEINKLRCEMQELASQKDAKIEQRHAKSMELSSFMSKNGISPFRVMGGAFVQMPLFMSTFFAIQSMAQQPIASFVSDGFLWMSNLSVADPTFILPTISTSLLLMSTEVSRRSMSITVAGPIMKLLMRIGALISLPFIMHMPAAMVTYFAMSNFMTFAFNTLWLSDTARGIFSIPKRTLHANMVKSAAASSPSTISRVSAAKLSWTQSQAPKIVSTPIYANKSRA